MHKYTLTLYTTHHTHSTRTRTNLQLHSDQKITILEKLPGLSMAPQATGASHFYCGCTGERQQNLFRDRPRWETWARFQLHVPTGPASQPSTGFSMLWNSLMRWGIGGIFFLNEWARDCAYFINIEEEYNRLTGNKEITKKLQSRNYKCQVLRYFAPAVIQVPAPL